MSDSDSKQINVAQYAVAFIDLLGQSEKLRNRFLPADRVECEKYLKDSVGRIFGTQRLFQSFYDGFSQEGTVSLYRMLPEDGKHALPSAAPGTLRWQRFSDGFVVFVPLSPYLTLSPINSVFAMLTAVGSICLVNLAAGSPVRVGLDVAWAVEYHPNELYGAAIAFAYELESKIAEYPRAVVGDGLLTYLRGLSQLTASNMDEMIQVGMANECGQLLAVDYDERHVVNFLAPWFVRNRDTSPSVDEVIRKARKFAETERAAWASAGNTKLSSRYERLLSFFDKFEPKCS